MVFLLETARSDCLQRSVAFHLGCHCNSVISHLHRDLSSLLRFVCCPFIGPFLRKQFKVQVHPPQLRLCISVSCWPWNIRRSFVLIRREWSCWQWHNRALQNVVTCVSSLYCADLSRRSGRSGKDNVYRSLQKILALTITRVRVGSWTESCKSPTQFRQRSCVTLQFSCARVALPLSYAVRHLHPWSTLISQVCVAI